MNSSAFTPFVTDMSFRISAAACMACYRFCVHILLVLELFQMYPQTHVSRSILAMSVDTMLSCWLNAFSSLRRHLISSGPGF
ncbi:DNA-binding protein [Dirofilaria immitis]